MYFYIYDSFLNASKYRKVLERIEVRLGHFGIQGKIRRLNILHHQKEIIEESVRRGAKTIVFIGNDRGILQAIDVLAKHDVAVGLIPIGGEGENRVARSLGIPLEVPACETLSRRTIARLDLGRIGLHHFLTTAEMYATTFTCTGPKHAFSIQPTCGKTTLTVINLPISPLKNGEISLESSPRDGVLELMLRDATVSVGELLHLTKRKGGVSIFPFQELAVTEPAGAAVHLDGCRVVKLPAMITVAPQKLRMIVGRERTFR